VLERSALRRRLVLRGDRQIALWRQVRVTNVSFLRCAARAMLLLSDAPVQQRSRHHLSSILANDSAIVLTTSQHHHSLFRELSAPFIETSTLLRRSYRCIFSDIAYNNILTASALLRPLSLARLIAPEMCLNPCGALAVPLLGLRPRSFCQKKSC
jgi:hypothetical protein